MPLPCSTSCSCGMVPTARGDEAFPQVILGAEVPLNEEIVKALREEVKQLITLWLRHGMSWIFIWYFQPLLDTEALCCFIACIFMVLIQKHKQDTS